MNEDPDALLARLPIIETRPLADRADAYEAVLVQLHDALEAEDEPA